uniref:Putative glucosyl/glucuronosyl transferase n=1 Tax=Anopheles darlingi TaxID=43151 RepID=A0A2M4DQA4_ANODA
MMKYSVITRLTFSVVLFALLAARHGDSAKIIGVFPTASKSHVLGLQVLLKELANRGHEVNGTSQHIHQMYFITPGGLCVHR